MALALPVLDEHWVALALPVLDEHWVALALPVLSRLVQQFTGLKLLERFFSVFSAIPR